MMNLWRKYTRTQDQRFALLCSCVLIALTVAGLYIPAFFAVHAVLAFVGIMVWIVTWIDNGEISTGRYE